MPEVIRFSPTVANVVSNFGSTGVSSVHLGSGTGESHAYVLHFDPGGQIGPHEAGFDQLFVVVSGDAWLTVEGATVELTSGEAGAVPRGSVHAKGSRGGATVVMVQMSTMATD
jgi:quercetin dioxygenase-like cupin family protein